MRSSVERVNKSIFIVNSGIAGSTILTWCLGQHPNIIPQEESDWLGPFSVDAAGYERGAARGERGQLSANFIQHDEFLSCLGQTINELILSHQKKFEDVNLWQAVWYSPLQDLPLSGRTEISLDGRSAGILFLHLRTAHTFPRSPLLFPLFGMLPMWCAHC